MKYPVAAAPTFNGPEYGQLQETWVKTTSLRPNALWDTSRYLAFPFNSISCTPQDPTFLFCQKCSFISLAYALRLVRSSSRGLAT